MANINLYISTSNTGYGIASKYILNELYIGDFDISLFTHGPLITSNPIEYDLLARLVNNKADWSAPCLNIWHEWDLGTRVGNGTYIAYPFFELNKLREQAKHSLLAPNLILTASKWSQEIIKKESGRQSTIVPLGVDTTIFFPTEKNKDGPYIFFNSGKFSTNKGHDFLIRCFDKAFTKQDNVELWMMPFICPFSDKNLQYWVNMYQQSKLHSKLQLIKPVSSHSDVASTIQQVDAGVFPFRAEGWNMPLLETLACGKPVIATNYGGPTEYLTSNNSSLLNIDEMERALDNAWFDGHGEWAYLGYEQEEQCIEYMRHMYRERPDNPEGVVTAQNFTWNHTGEQISQILLDSV